jgi:hypothetical protein
VIEQIEEVIPPMRSAEWFDQKKRQKKKEISQTQDECTYVF